MTKVLSSVFTPSISQTNPGLLQKSGKFAGRVFSYLKATSTPVIRSTLNIFKSAVTKHPVATGALVTAFVATKAYAAEDFWLSPVCSLILSGALEYAKNLSSGYFQHGLNRYLATVPSDVFNQTITNSSAIAQQFYATNLNATLHSIYTETMTPFMANLSSECFPSSTFQSWLSGLWCSVPLSGEGCSNYGLSVLDFRAFDDAALDVLKTTLNPNSPYVNKSIDPATYDTIYSAFSSLRDSFEDPLKQLQDVLSRFSDYLSTDVFYSPFYDDSIPQIPMCVLPSEGPSAIEIVGITGGVAIGLAATVTLVAYLYKKYKQSHVTQVPLLNCELQQTVYGTL